MLAGSLLLLAIGGPGVATQPRTTPFGDQMSAVVSVLPDWPPGSYNAREPEGSGVVIFDGHTIMTALHVVGKARSIRVRTSTGLILKATIHGKDRATDLAMLKVERRLPHLTIGGDVTLGERVCAIGNIFGMGLSLSCGTVSAVHRAGVGFNAVEDFIQTDAAVNPGASGGALVNADGKLVGLLASIFANNLDTNAGVNFAVSASLLSYVATQLRDRKVVRWRFGGLATKPYPPKGELGEVAVEVIEIRPGSLAEAAGLKIGDRITWAAKRRVRNPSQFRSVLTLALSTGDVELIVVSAGKMKKLTIGQSR